MGARDGLRAIVLPPNDPAAENIGRHVIELGGFRRTGDGTYAAGRMILLEGEPAEVRLPEGVEEVIVASRHESRSGRPCLTVHAPGLPEEMRLPPSSPPTVKCLLAEMKRLAEDLSLPHQVSLEATHHGPSDFPVPITFAEIGSSKDEWINDLLGEVVARAILFSMRPPACRRAVGVGGPHYSPLHTRVSLETEIGIGHILPGSIRIGEGLVEMAVRKSSAEMIVVDWKGTERGQREACLRVSERMGIELVKAGDLLSKKA